MRKGGAGARAQALSTPISVAPSRQHREIQRLIHLADVVFRGQHAVQMAMHHHPAIALGIAAAAVKGMGLSSQACHQELMVSGPLGSSISR